MNDAIEIPIEALEAPQLRALVEAFVTREGTDYGDYETQISVKVDQVIAQIRRGQAKIWWHSESEAFDILRVD